MLADGFGPVGGFFSAVRAMIGTVRWADQRPQLDFQPLRSADVRLIMPNLPGNVLAQPVHGASQQRNFIDARPIFTSERLNKENLGLNIEVQDALTRGFCAKPAVALRKRRWTNINAADVRTAIVRRRCAGSATARRCASA